MYVVLRNLTHDLFILASYLTTYSHLMEPQLPYNHLLLILPVDVLWIVVLPIVNLPTVIDPSFSNITLKMSLPLFMSVSCYTRHGQVIQMTMNWNQQAIAYKAIHKPTVTRTPFTDNCNKWHNMTKRQEHINVNMILHI